MDFNLFLWPMLLPMIIPILYCTRYKKESLADIGVITGVMFFIVILYWPLLTTNFLSTHTYITVKFLLFVILPVICLQIIKRKKSLGFKQYGIKKEGLKKSTLWCILFLPIMLGVTTVIHYINGVTIESDVLVATVSFFEAFTEEFFFRGILFIFLISRTNLKIAYITSLVSFVLIHPQHFETIFIIGPVVQGILTIEICRRSNNLIGAWLLHGANRFFTIAIIPLLLLS
ncbi:MAG: CPBP family intramembrane metalloprotease [Thermoplasmatales archaeon]|nr:MAG: CPBP family intramembrane metalloprotease [Thermoplasmatales archaeon]